jgi:hypothetical protein
MTNLLRKLFQAEKMGQEESRTINVLVSLKAPPDDLCLAELQKIGLMVNLVEGNKLIGKIVPAQLSKLENYVSVVEVERSVQLRPTNDSVHVN